MQHASVVGSEHWDADAHALPRVELPDPLASGFVFIFVASTPAS
jgi:hypothetical protein